MDSFREVFPRTIKASQLQIGDTIQLDLPEWNSAIVKNIDADGRIQLFRPYGTTADFTYTGGVICYIGIEEYYRAPDANVMFTLLSRRKLR